MLFVLVGGIGQLRREVGRQCRPVQVERLVDEVPEGAVVTARRTWGGLTVRIMSGQVAAWANSQRGSAAVPFTSGGICAVKSSEYRGCDVKSSR